MYFRSPAFAAISRQLPGISDSKIGSNPSIYAPNKDARVLMPDV